MKRSHWWVGVIVAVVAVVVAGCSTGLAGTGSTGVRLWYAQYDQTFTAADGSSFTFEGGYGPMVMVQFNGRISDDVKMVTIFGYGQGWDEDEDIYGLDMDVRRLDGLLGFAWRVDYFSFGVAGHGILVWNELNEADGTWLEDQFYVFVGPELFAGAAVPFLENRFVASVSASVMPVALWVHTVDMPNDDASDSGTTFGYTLDAGVMVLLGDFILGGGYRFQVMDEIDYELEGDTFTSKRSHEDEFQGPYLNAGWTW